MRHGRFPTDELKLIEKAPLYPPVFRPGDMAELRSGSMPMHVLFVDDDEHKTCIVYWRNEEGRVSSGQFPSICLVKHTVH